MISRTSEYALRAAIQLGRCPERSLTTREIAESSGVPPSYLAKVLGALSRAELVVAQRGPNGGYVLGHPPEETTLLDIVNAVDPIRRITKCPLGLPEHRAELCPLHRILDEATRLAENTLASRTIADLICDLPKDPPHCAPRPKRRGKSRMSSARKQPKRKGS